MKCLPWVGVAIPLTQDGTDAISYEDVTPEGNIFCFLPLPPQDTSQTGNAYCRMQGKWGLQQKTISQVHRRMTPTTL